MIRTGVLALVLLVGSPQQVAVSPPPSACGLATGNISSPATVAVVNTGGAASGLFPVPEIQQFLAPSAGNFAPSQRIVGPATGMAVGTAMTALAVDKSANFFVTSSANGTISSFASASAGNVSPQLVFSGANNTVVHASGITIDTHAVALQTTYVTDQTLNVLDTFAYPATGGAKAPTAVWHKLNGPSLAAFDRLGRVWIADTNGNEIVGMPAGGNGPPFQKITSGVNRPVGVAWIAAADSLGNNYDAIYNTNLGNNSITVHNGDTGALLATISGSKTLLNAPTGIALDHTVGEIYVANFGDDSVLYFPAQANGNYRPDGQIKGPSTHIHKPLGIAVETFTPFGSPTSGTTSPNMGTEMAGPLNARLIAITEGPDGNYWLLDDKDNRVVQLSPSGMTAYAVPTSAAGLMQITWGADGNLWFTEHASGKIGRMTPAGVATEFPLPNGHKPFGIAPGDNGNVWFTEDTNAVGYITPSGAITEYALVPGVQPRYITPGPGGPAEGMWFTASGPGGWAVIGITDNGFPWGSLTIPNGQLGPLTVGADCNVYVSDVGNNSVDVLSATSLQAHVQTFVQLPLPSQSASPAGIAAGHDGSIWVTEFHANKIVRISYGGPITEYSVPTAGGGPAAIAAGADGTLRFAEATTNKVGTIKYH